MKFNFIQSSANKLNLSDEEIPEKYLSLNLERGVENKVIENRRKENIPHGK